MHGTCHGLSGLYLCPTKIVTQCFMVTSNTPYLVVTLGISLQYMIEFCKFTDYIVMALRKHINACLPLLTTLDLPTSKHDSRGSHPNQTIVTK